MTCVPQRNHDHVYSLFGVDAPPGCYMADVAKTCVTCMTCVPPKKTCAHVYLGSMPHGQCLVAKTCDMTFMTCALPPIKNAHVYLGVDAPPK